ncbi:MAG: hypothetical protein AAFU71_18735 [Cyanobacteria bacterium J06632_22]
MSRKLLWMLPGAVGLAALLSSVLVPSEDYWRSELSQLQVVAQTQMLSSNLTEMSLDRLEEILVSEVPDLQGSGGQWQAELNGRSVIVLADPTNNRMRIVVPVVATSALSEEQIQAMLVANFHSALDARYAVSNGAVVAVFVHPLSTLQETDLRSGLHQVVNLAETFGSSYSSGGLGFLPNGQRREAPAVPEGSIGI